MDDDNESVIFNEIFTNADILYTLMTNAIKEEIILYEYSGINEFVFEITLKNGKLDIIDNKVLIKNNNEEIIGRFEDLYMYDNNEIYSNDVKYEIIQENDKYYYKIIANNDFLTDKTTVYPVVIDPIIVLTNDLDTYVSSYYPSTNYYNATFLETTGNNGWTADEVNNYVSKSYIKFSQNMFSSFYMQQVVSANLTLEVKAKSTTSVQPKINEVLNDFYPTSLTYGSSSSLNIDTTNSYSNSSTTDKVVVDITPILKKWQQQYYRDDASMAFKSWKHLQEARLNIIVGKTLQNSLSLQSLQLLTVVYIQRVRMLQIRLKVKHK